MIPHPTNVNSKTEFLQFLEELRADLKQNPADWENPTLELYLGALAAWLEVYENSYRNTGQPVPINVSWRFFADALAAARIYE